MESPYQWQSHTLTPLICPWSPFYRPQFFSDRPFWMRYFCCYHIGCAILGIIRKSSCVTKMVVNILLLLAVVSCTFSPAEGQITPKSKKYFAVTEDLPFIRCSVCRRALKHIAQQVKELRSEVPSKGKKVRKSSRHSEGYDSLTA